jgi:23S rRNA (cytosine1962-C5)-methyltransferase
MFVEIILNLPVMENSPFIQLKPGREKSVLRKHPWIFSNAIARVAGNPAPGATIGVLASNGNALGFASYSPQSQITARFWSFDPQIKINKEFFREKLNRALQMRRFLFKNADITACRFVNAESDELPGLIVDCYGQYLVCQFLSCGSEFWKKEIVNLLAELYPCIGIYERSDADVRAKEGLPSSEGNLFGQEPPERIEIREESCSFWVDIRNGHKTGFYLDQRESRKIILEYTKGAKVLNCFAYTGGFCVRALKGGAEFITNVEASGDSLAVLHENLALNQLDDSKVENVEGDVFKVLREYRNTNRLFDMVILDPPKFAASKSQLMKACRGYKDINLLAMKILSPGGILVTFSCSGLLSGELFQKIVADAALDAGRFAQIVKRLNQGADHPTSLNFPEGTYLKGLICKVY